MNKPKYIAVALGTAWELKKEDQGWIFRQMNDLTYGFAGHYITAGSAIRSILDQRATVVKCNGTLQPATVLTINDAKQIP